MGTFYHLWNMAKATGESELGYTLGSRVGLQLLCVNWSDRTKIKKWCVFFVQSTPSAFCVFLSLFSVLVLVPFCLLPADTTFLGNKSQKDVGD